MTDYTELKRLAEAATPGPWSYDGSYVCPARVEEGTTYVETWRSVADCAQPENTKFIAAANPFSVLAMIAESDRLTKLLERTVEQYVPLTELEGVQGWSRVVELVEVVTERDQLRAENAGLKTGYEAYERGNAELKAEVEELRKYGEEFAVLAERRREEADALRKDSESYRLLSFCHGQGTLELVRSHHELCAEIRRLKILAGEPVPPTPEEFIGPSPEGPTARIRRKLAAIGKGEQS
ncbi:MULTISPECIES: hypothetical protein [Pseudomonas]|uniref:Ead/Ea22-like family protein n=1 Tax=Pseudomonas lactis TaxID=1615674 RepID=A0ABS9FKU3_9PSED|nr:MULTISPECIES: hypothetical protein [Pseudomonas]MBI6975119.1 hypothetical protein [Pseudomonas lactis]MCF4974151.1 hypothetical protein [Pseudomonas lactis]MCF5003932.1 hypothetical protein [Pseudomonas lactis]MCF5009229.1 hypothetical protein [Pseudomonas lactis]MCF5014692.1 hypothetical protein [Pseudomonas lactis]